MKSFYEDQGEITFFTIFESTHPLSFLAFPLLLFKMVFLHAFRVASLALLVSTLTSNVHSVYGGERYLITLYVSLPIHNPEIC